LECVEGVLGDSECGLGEGEEEGHNFECKKSLGQNAQLRQWGHADSQQKSNQNRATITITIIIIITKA
jgi:hypothetical protein